MDKIIELLMKQPIIAFFLVIWVVGAITNALKAKQKVRDRNEAKTRPTPVPRTGSADSSAGGAAVGKSSSDIIADRAVGGSKRGAVVGGMGTGEQKRLEQQRQAPASMRGRDRQVIPADKPAPAAKPAAKTPDQVAREMRRILGLEEPPTAAPAPARPTPARPTPPPIRSEPILIDPASVSLSRSPSNAQKHVDSHVGEGLRGRHLAATKVGQTVERHSDRGAIGNLGGRTKARMKQLAPAERRYAMADLRRLIVMNEILSPPIAMRPKSDRVI